jgi:hypothetical protein
MNEFSISKQKINVNNPNNKDRIREFINNLINNANKDINKEPTNIFIDNRLLNVND